jgi:hypothetical protein
MTKPVRIHLSSDMLHCGMIRESGVPSTDIVWAPELFSVGPILPPWEAQHAQVRREFWKKLYGSLWDTSDMPDAYDSMCQALDKFTRADEIIIWAGPSLDEQLFFVWSVAVLLHLGLDKNKIRYLLVNEDPYSRRSLSRLGLSYQGYAQVLHTGGRILDDDEFLALEEAWQAICSPDPREATRCRRNTPPKLSLIFDRLEHLCRHYPSIKTGLNDFEYRLLQICAKCGPSAIAINVEYVVYDHDEFDQHGSSQVLLPTLLKLASDELKHPLLKLEGDPTEFRSFTVKLTDAGKAVLLGEANYVELNGIDKWIGGVHLKSPGPIWFYDIATTRLVLKECL